MDDVFVEAAASPVGAGGLLLYPLGVRFNHVNWSDQLGCGYYSWVSGVVKDVNGPAGGNRFGEALGQRKGDEVTGGGTVNG